MKNNTLYQQTRSPFEEIKKYETTTKAEYWYARDLMKLLGYVDWDKFKLVIDKAWYCCNRTLQHIADYDRTLSHATSDRHFFPLLSDKLPNGINIREEKVLDYKLSRYACYVIVMNADSCYEEVAQIQNYFALTLRIFQEVNQVTPILSIPAPSPHLSIKHGLIFITSTHLAKLLKMEAYELFCAIETCVENETGRSRKQKKFYRPEGEDVAQGFIIARGKRSKLYFNLTEAGFAKTMIHLRYLYPSLAEKITEIESMIFNDFEIQKQPFLNYIHTTPLPEPQ